MPEVPEHCTASCLTLPRHTTNIHLRLDDPPYLSHVILHPTAGSVRIWILRSVLGPSSRWTQQAGLECLDVEGCWTGFGVSVWVGVASWLVLDRMGKGVLWEEADERWIVLRVTIHMLRAPLRYIGIPIDENIYFHRQVAYCILFWTMVHTTAHYVNLYVVPSLLVPSSGQVTNVELSINVERTQARPEAAWAIHYTQAGGITGHAMLFMSVSPSHSFLVLSADNVY